MVTTAKSTSPDWHISFLLPDVKNVRVNTFNLTEARVRLRTTSTDLEYLKPNEKPSLQFSDFLKIVCRSKPVLKLRSLSFFTLYFNMYIIIKSRSCLEFIWDKITSSGGRLQSSFKNWFQKITRVPELEGKTAGKFTENLFASSRFGE